MSQSLFPTTGTCQFIFSSDVGLLVRCRIDKLLPEARALALIGDEPLDVEVELVTDGEVIAKAQSTQSVFDPSPDAGHFRQQHFVFPARLRDLPRESSFVVFLRSQAAGRTIYRGVLPLFTDRAVLRQGRQLLAMVPVDEQETMRNEGDKYPDLAWNRHSNDLVLETASHELREAIRLSKIRDLLERNCVPRAAPGFEESDYFFESEASKAVAEAGLPWLRVQLPVYQHAVLFLEPQIDAQVDVSGTLGACSKDEVQPADLVSLLTDEWLLKPITLPEDLAGSCRKFKNVVELDTDQPHPATLKYMRLSGRSRLKDRDARPNPDESKQLDELVACPKRIFSDEERQLLFRFRWHLVGNPSALTKFLHAVDWNEPQEKEHALELVETWKEVEVEDAMEMLSREFKNLPLVRRMAVKKLQQANDDDICMYLLQLVQALRYEPSEAIYTATAAAATAAPPGAAAAGQSPEAEKPSPSTTSQEGKDEDDTTLAGFLIKRACMSKRVGSSLFWYLSAENETRENGGYFEIVRTRLIEALKKHPEISTVIDRQAALRRKLLWAMNIAKAENRGKSADHKIKNFKTRILEDPPGTDIPLDLGQGLAEPIPLPTDPRLLLWKAQSNNSTLLKSAQMPAVVACEVFHDGEDPSKSFTKKIMIKQGDDLRQDQLVLQLFILMDSILKKYGLDLELTPYKVIAMSGNDGIVDFVPDAWNISTILKENNGQIQDFLRKFHRRPDARDSPCQDNTYNIQPEVYENFIRSCAGYCVITYLLGVGDRHLDNLMVTSDGKLFHIDFGYILGRDPKPFQPQIRMCKEMVEGMGGFASAGYDDFKSKCAQAMRILRRHSKLILNLLHLMVDSGIKDMGATLGEAQFAILQVESKFAFGMSDDQLEAHFNTVIEASVNAFLPSVYEVVHRVNVARQ